jgi:hypothetical protein
VHRLAERQAALPDLIAAGHEKIEAAKAQREAVQHEAH